MEDAIRDILLLEWDPIGVNEIDEARDEYDSYVPVVCQLIVRGASTLQLFDYLWWLETEHMGLPGRREHTMTIAARLSALVGDR